MTELSLASVVEMEDSGVYSTWLLLAMIAILEQDRPEPPRRKAVFRIECNGCGDVYYGDPYYAPRFCSHCGGAMVGATYTVENPEHESWERLQKLKQMLDGKAV